MNIQCWRILILSLGIVTSGLCVAYHNGHNRGNLIIVNPSVPIGSYYNNYYPSYYNSNDYYPSPSYHCEIVPRCYPSGDCNYQNQQCSYY